MWRWLPLLLALGHLAERRQLLPLRRGGRGAHIGLHSFRALELCLIGGLRLGQERVEE